MGIMIMGLMMSVCNVKGLILVLNANLMGVWLVVALLLVIYVKVVV